MKPVNVPLIWILQLALPAFAFGGASQTDPKGNTVIETYDEDFSHFNVDRPYRWDFEGHRDLVVVDRSEGYIGLRGASDPPTLWISSRLGKGDGITHHLNHSLYHLRSRLELAKSYELTLRIISSLARTDQDFMARIEWFEGERTLGVVDLPIKRGCREWTTLRFAGQIPRAATEYQLILTGSGGTAGRDNTRSPSTGGTTPQDNFLYVDRLTMQVFVEDPPVDFPPAEELRRLRVGFPLNVREFHVWWHTPWHVDDWARLGGENRRFKNPFSSLWDKNAWTIRMDDWLRDIDSRQYPLIGPYDSFNREVIDWQIASMKNAGLDGAFVNLFPNRSNFDMDYGPAEEIFSRILTSAEKHGFQVALYDENYRHDLFANAARDVLFLRKYIDRPGYYRIRGQPAVWIQNFNEHLYSPSELKRLINYIEARLETDLYWVVSLFRFNRPITERRKAYLTVEEIDCIDFRYAVEEIAKNQETGEISWYAMEEGLKDFIESLRNSTVRHDWSASVSPGFDTVTDYTREADVIWDGYVMPNQARDRGLTLLKELFLLSRQDPPPAFVTIKSWNDYHEGHGIEPGYYYEHEPDRPLGLNEEPYFYTKLVAGLLGKQFQPAPLPPLQELDPLIRNRFREPELQEDLYGPVFTARYFEQGRFIAELADSRSEHCRLIRDRKPAAGFRAATGKVEPWGLRLEMSSGSEQESIAAVEAGGQWALRIPGGDSSLSVELSQQVAERLKSDSRAFLVIEVYDRNLGSGKYANVMIDYPSSEGMMRDRRIRLYNNGTWKWVVQCLYRASFGESKELVIHGGESELLIRSLYVVVPGLSRQEEDIPAESPHRFIVERTPSEGAQLPIEILYGQDGDGNFGNLLVVDIAGERVVPDVFSVVSAAETALVP